MSEVIIVLDRNGIVKYEMVESLERIEIRAAPG